MKYFILLLLAVACTAEVTKICKGYSTDNACFFDSKMSGCLKEGDPIFNGSYF